MPFTVKTKDGKTVDLFKIRRAPHCSACGVYVDDCHKDAEAVVCAICTATASTTSDVDLIVETLKNSCKACGQPRKLSSAKYCKKCMKERKEARQQKKRKSVG